MLTTKLSKNIKNRIGDVMHGGENTLVGAICTIVTATSVWLLKNNLPWSGKDRRLSKEDHAEICRLTTEPFKERFVQGEENFRELRELIEHKFEIMLERIDKLR
jgi:hypothetical protein